MFARLMGLKTVSPRDLRDQTQAQRVTVIDVNSRESFKVAHVLGALNLDHERYEAADLPADPDAEIVFYCSNSLCRKAAKAAQRAQKMGYRNVRVMSARIKGWVETQLPTESA